jgi:hypothetical protein
MASAKLSALPERSIEARPRAGGLPRACVRAYTAIWAQTLGLAAAVALSGAALGAPTRQLLALRLSAEATPAPSVARVIELFAHNLPIAAWPLLLGAAGARQHPLARRVADTAVLACIALNALPVGAALGAYGVPLLPYIPQLPLEWAALALGAGSWLAHRNHPMSLRTGFIMFAVVGSALLAAATLETVAVPHR